MTHDCMTVLNPHKGASVLTESSMTLADLDINYISPLEQHMPDKNMSFQATCDAGAPPA